MKSLLLSSLLFVLVTLPAFAQDQMLTNNPGNTMTDYVAVGNMGAFPDNGAVSFALRASVVENYRNVLTTGCISDCNIGIRFEENNDGSLGYVIGNDGGNLTGAVFMPAGTFLPNVWHHVVLTWDKPANNVKTYVDGILKTNLSCTFWPTQLGNVNIGVGWGLSRKFAGNLDAVTLWKRTLTLSEVQSLNAGTVNAGDPDLKGYWNFDDNATNGAGQTVLNNATNFPGQYNGTTVGTASTPVFEPSTWVPTPPPPPPTISSISPASGHAGASATVTGTDLNTGTVTVTIGGIAATNVSVISATEVSFNTPVTGEGMDQAVVVTVGGQSSTEVVTYDYELWDIHSVSSGLWHNASTWDCNCVPNQSDTITIESGHTISENCYCPHTVSGVMVINGTLDATYGFTALSTAKVSGTGTLEGTNCNCPTAVINTSDYSVQNTNNNVQFNQPVSIQNYTANTNGGGLYGATVTVNGTFTYVVNSGFQGIWAPLVIAPGATMNLTSYPSGNFSIRNGMVNNGTVNMISGAGIDGNNGSGTNPTMVNNGTWNQNVDCVYTRFLFENNGAFNMNGTGLSDMVGSSPSFQSTFHNNADGTLTVTSGTLNMGPFTNAGTVTGNGTLQYSTAVTNTGHFAPGLPLGTLDIVGNFINAVLDMEIVAGTPVQHDVLDITGNLVLTGSTLNVTTAECPADGNYDIITYTGTLTGGFTNLTLPPGHTVTYDEGAKKVVLVVDGCVIDPDNDGDNFTVNEGDCDDNDPDEFPGQTWYIDTDGDNYGGAAVTQCLRPTNGHLLSELASGSTGTDDCTDTNDDIYPGATEICDNLDNDCDGQTDEGVLLTFYADADGDGYGNAAATTQACSAPVDYVSDNTDCNDNPANDGANQHPGQTWYIDADGDNYGASSVTQCARPTNGKLLSELASGSTGTDDCNDNCATCHPGATEICDNLNNDCDGQTDEGVLLTFYADADGDGYGNAAATTQACSAPVGYVSDNTDCNDNPANDGANQHPGQTWYIDADGDNYGASSVTQCARPTNGKLLSELASGSTGTDDCNDNCATCHPGATEICDNLDNDCDGQTDEGVLLTFYADTDGDGYGNAAATTQACSAPVGYVANSTDCNDDNDDIYPGATEVCDNLDNDCDGQIDEGLAQHPDYAALMAIYNATNGANWTDNTGWGTSTCNVCNWHGVSCNGNSRVTSLILSFNQLQGSIPPEIGDLSHLTQLALNGNQLSGLLSVAISNLDGLALTFLNLTENQLSGNIPTSIGSFTALESFGVANNPLSGSIPSEIGSLTNMGYLNLYSSQLTGPLPPQLGNLTNLVVLGLFNNQLSGCIPASYTEFCSGTYVDMSSNPGLPGGGDFAAFCADGTGECVTDVDGDGYSIPDDCDDANDDIYPGATEICDNLDNDCDGQTDEGVTLTFYADADGDGYGNPAATTQACSAPSGYVANSTDCNDNCATCNSAAAEICDGLDNDCDGQTDEGLPQTWTGATSTDWNIGSNWCSGHVPLATEYVIIPDAANDPVIMGGMAAVAHYVTINVGGLLTVNATGSCSATFGILNQGTVENSGLITMGSTSFSSGIRNYGTFNNNTGGEIRIDWANGQYGLLNQSGTFTNAAKITIGEVGFSYGHNYGILNSATFSNNTGGDIRIDRSAYVGLANGGTFTNAAKITIGEVAITGQTGIDNLGTFNNNTGGEIRINRSTYSGLRNGLGTFTNAAKIIIGAVTSAGTYGINNSSTFNNNAGGEISIDRSTGYGLHTYGTFTNAAKIAIGTGVGVAGMGIGNWGTFNNSACATLTLIAPINNNSSFTNSGLFTVSTTAAHINSGLINNGIIQYLQFNYIPNVINNDLIVRPVTGACPITNALQIGGANSFTAGSIWYTDQSLTTPAGTYNQGSNTFTFNTLPAEGTYTLYCSISENVNGCSRTVSIRVTYDDVTPPTITCPANISKPADAGVCTSAATYAVTATDNCTATSDIALIRTSGLASGSTFPGGTSTVVWQATDATGNMTTCAFTVTINDGQMPSVICPNNIVRNTDSGQCSALVTYANPTFSDNCSGTTIQRTSGQASGTAFQKGIHSVNWQATDAAGLVAVCNFTVTVIDQQLPNITCPANMTRSTDAGLCTAVVNYTTPTATDNCGSVTVARTGGLPPNSVFPLGPTLVTWEATDGANPANKRSCTFTVTVNDNQLPTITCPANMTRNTDAGLCTAVVNYTTPTATDNCTNVSVMLVSGLASGSAFPKGQTTVQWKATDGANLTRTCTFRVTVNDTQLPNITCPASQSVNTDAGLCTALVTYTTPTASDNCAPPTVVRTGGLPSNANFPRGTTNVTWKATDGANLTRTCTFTVTVTDAQLPTITCPANISVTAAPGQCSAMVTYANVTATDNCSVQSPYLLSGLSSGASFSQGVTTNTWRAVDNSGGSSTCAFTVTVNCGASPSQPPRWGGDWTAERDAVSPPHRGGWEGLLRLAPNPATTEVKIWVEGVDSETIASRSAEWTVFDARGRAVWQQSLAADGSLTQPFTLSLLDFRAGLYFVTLRLDGHVLTKRLVVSKL